MTLPSEMLLWHCGYGKALSRGVLDSTDEVLRQIKTEFPIAGYRRVHSQLVSRGIRVSHLRVGEAMHRCDPEGTAMRWLTITPRAKYCVSGPLALWHIDGNHKLIRYVRLLYY